MEGYKSELLCDLGPKKPRVEITGSERVLVENHRGIIEYDEGQLRLRCLGGEVRIVGMDLQLLALSMEELAVSGLISSVEYFVSEKG